MKKLITSTLVGGALVGSILGLTACDPSKPVAGIGDTTVVGTTYPAPVTATKAAFTLPAATDFSIGITELQRHCFGSAGCNVVYTVSASYVGTATIPSTETFRVLYTVTGADDAMSGYLTWRNGALYGDDEQMVSVTQGSVLTAQATSVIR
jgi:hypothetical protein